MENMFAAYEPGRNRRAATSLPQALSVRPALAPDARALAAIAHERQGGTLADHRLRFERELDEARGLLLVAELDGALAGYGRASCFRPEPGHPANVCPAGWYLAGVIVRPPHRRCGIGRELTRRRLAWIGERACEAYFLVNARNTASVDMHAALGFEELTRDFFFPGVTFTGGQGILFRALL